MVSFVPQWLPGSSRSESVSRWERSPNPRRLLCTGLFGSSDSGLTSPKLVAAQSSSTIAGPSAGAGPGGLDLIGALIAVFVSDGTAEHPDAGLLIGNGGAGGGGSIAQSNGNQVVGRGGGRSGGSPGGASGSDG